MATKTLTLNVNFITAINCEWGTWGEWGECSTSCGDGSRERQRVHAIVAQFGGDNCTGEPMDNKSCNVLEEIKLVVAQQQAQLLMQQAQIEDLKRQIEEAQGKCKILGNAHYAGFK